MKTRFLHIADIHLGYEQYGSEQRYKDFCLSFRRAVDDALQERVNFVVLAGDLFHQRSIAPGTLYEAHAALSRLHEAHIPVVAVVGNHERPHYRDNVSWLHFLAGTGLLAILNPERAGEQLVYPRYEDGAGGQMDVGEVRLYGMNYYGELAPRLIAETAGFLQAEQAREGRPPFTIFVTHAGLAGILPNFSANLSAEEAALLRPYVDYLALGHVHKPFIQDGWIFNPGSIEPVTIAEADYRGGGLLVDVDTEREPAIHTEARTFATRPFVRLRLRVDGFDDPEALYAGVERQLRAQQTPARPPVVEYVLEGTLPFDHGALDMRRVEALIEAVFQPIYKLVPDRTTPTEYEIAAGDRRLSRPELEHRVLTDLVAQDARYRPRAEAWVGLIRDLKQLALDKASPAAIAEELRAGMARAAVAPANDEQGTDDAHHAG